jgi:hypothetical protein
MADIDVQSSWRGLSLVLTHNKRVKTDRLARQARGSWRVVGGAGAEPLVGPAADLKGVM